MRLLSLLKNVVLLVGILLVTTACSKEFPRGQFQGYVMDLTEQEIVSKVGPPAEVDRKNPEKPVLIFKNKTFDTDNFNKPDPITRVYLEKNKEGKIIATSVAFG